MTEIVLKQYVSYVNNFKCNVKLVKILRRSHSNIIERNYTNKYVFCNVVFNVINSLKLGHLYNVL